MGFLKNITALVFLILLVSTQDLKASSYLPNLTCYEKQDYQAGRQNWDIDIDKYGVVYFGNSDGLLYNVYGEWILAPMSQKGPVRAVLADNDTIWCGGGEYGYFTKIDGEMVFHQLGELEGGLVWNIEAFDKKIIFQSENIIVQYNKADQSILSQTYPEGIWAMTEWRGKIWMALRDGQIGYLNDGIFQRLIQSELFLQREIRKLFVHKDLLYIVMFEGCVYQFDGETVSQVSLPGSLEGKTLFTGISYDESSYCLGTVSNGFMQIGNGDKILNWVHSDHGLIDNTVLSMKSDEFGNIWLGLDFGIAKIELNSAINDIFNGGATYSIKNFQGNTFLATNKGLFRSSDNGAFEFVENSGGQTWMVREIDHELYICHNRGLFKLEGEQFLELAKFSGFLDIAHFEGTDYFLCSTYHGVMLLHREDGQFSYVENLEIWGNTKLVYDKSKQCIWAEMTDKPIIKLSLNPDFSVQREEFPGKSKVFALILTTRLRSCRSLFGQRCARCR